MTALPACRPRSTDCTRWRSAPRRWAPASMRIRSSAPRPHASLADGNRSAVPRNQQSLRGAVVARCDRRDQRRVAHPGCRAVQDGQRRPAVCLRPSRRHRRAADPRERAGIVDHARQDQPDTVRGDDDGGGARVRQRHRGGLCQHAGPFSAQRLQAGDAAQRARVDRAAGRRVAQSSIATARAASSRISIASGSTSRNR